MPVEWEVSEFTYLWLCVQKYPSVFSIDEIDCRVWSPVFMSTEFLK